MSAINSKYAILRVASPVDDNDAVTKFYADSLEKPLIIRTQADTSSAIPNNTGTRGFVVVTTAGSGAALGDILYDDGTGVGTMQILAAVEGRTIAVTDTLSGGTISFDADSINIWDADGSSWIKVGDVGSVSGAIRVIRYAITNAATQDSTSQIPANARVYKSRLSVTTSYSGGATIVVGNTTTPNLFMESGQNNPQASSGKAYEVDQDTANGVSASVVRTTIAGAPAAGAGVVSVWYGIPNA